MTELPRNQIRLSDLSNRKATPFSLVPDAGARATIAAELGIEAIRKLRFDGELRPSGAKDWQLDGMLGATVVQLCVVTLAPVTTRIDEAVRRSFLAELPEVTGTEVEMPEDDTVEALRESLDLAEVMIEALSLALPPYPRAEGATLGEAVFAPKGVSPMRDEEAKPFAGLAALRENLEKKGD